jgi:predicted phage terminase large subunit-like protein
MILQEEQLLASIVKESFYEFVKEFWNTIIHEEPYFNWHIEYLCNELQEVAERVFKGIPKQHNLIINVPPGSTKSTICSQMFPAWVWTRMPSAKFICASYAHAIALKDSIRTRDIVQSELYQRCFPNVQLREDENMKGLFVNTQKGFRLSAGIGGAVTGYHGHFLIVDDPLNPEEAYSDQELKVANRWMETTLPSRKIDKLVTPTILVQQRLHQADPTGEALAKAHNGDVRHICLPGELTDKVSPPELAARYVDGLLDPKRLPRDVLQGMKTELGEYGYSSQILQDPVPLSGGMFKTDRIVFEQHAIPTVRNVRSWDKAGTKDGGAWSVGVLMGIDSKGEIWVLDVVRGQWAAREREQNIKQTAEIDGTNVLVLLEIEGGSGGKESGENTVRNLLGYRVEVFHPTGDKESRAYGFASQMGGGTVHVLKKPWTRDYIEELRFFPHSKYKDQVDASSGAFNKIARKKKVIGSM